MEAQFGNFLIEKVSQSDFDEPSKPVNVVSSSTVSLPPVMTSSTVPSAKTSSVVLSSVMTSSPALMTRITSSAVPYTGAATSAVPIIVMTSSSGDMTQRSLAETIPVISEILPHGREDQEVAGEIEEHLVEVHDQSLNNVEGEQIIGDANINIEHRVVLNENGEVILLKTNEEDTSHLQSFDNTPSNVDEIQRQGQRKTEHLLSELEQRLISGQEKILNCNLSHHIIDVFRGQLVDELEYLFESKMSFIFRLKLSTINMIFQFHGSKLVLIQWE